MSSAKKFEELKCWQASRELVSLVYKLSNVGELARDFEAKNQVRGAALSVMNNIAEGFGRESHREFMRFLEISHASCLEVKSITYVLEDVKYLSVDDIQSIHVSVEKTKALIRGLMKYLRNNPRPE